VGWNEDNLTEQQSEKKRITSIWIKIIYRVQFSHHLILNLLMSSKLAFPMQLSHLNTELDVTWYWISRLTG